MGPRARDIAAVHCNTLVRWERERDEEEDFTQKNNV